MALLLSLGACSDADLSGLERQLEAMRVSPGQVELEPLPPMPTYDIVAYEFADQRSPFRPEVAEEEAQPQVTSGVAPGTTRPKEPLEAYALSQLSLVGTLTVGGEPSALIKAPDGKVHRLGTGNYMGSDFGRIISITDTSVQLVEVVPTGRGGWEERSNQLKLDD